MLASKSLETFFKENLVNDLDYFLFYKDQKLLEESNYQEFAKKQLKKIKYVMLSIGFGIFYGAYFISSSFIQYGSEGNEIDLILGLITLLFVCYVLFITTKKYYTVKSSMDLFLKILDENEG